MEQILAPQANDFVIFYYQGQTYSIEVMDILYDGEAPWLVISNLGIVYEFKDMIIIDVNPLFLNSGKWERYGNA